MADSEVARGKASKCYVSFNRGQISSSAWVVVAYAVCEYQNLSAHASQVTLQHEGVKLMPFSTQ
eukprot:3884779-Amphidinium_carterae.2